MGGVAVVWVPPYTHLMKGDYITMSIQCQWRLVVLTQGS